MILVFVLSVTQPLKTTKNLYKMEKLVNLYYKQWLLTTDPYTSEIDFKDLISEFGSFTLNINTNEWILI